MSKRKQNRSERGTRRGAAWESVRSLGSLGELARRSPAHRAIAQGTLNRLYNLSNRVGASLSHHADRQVRRLASLVVIGTLALSSAACAGTAAEPPDQPTQVEVIQTDELTAEVAEGLPSGRGQTYEVKGDSVVRDHRGVYHFQWLDAQSPEPRTASVSRLQLVQAQGNRAELTMPQEGDPVLALPAGSSVTLLWPKPEGAPDATPTPGAPVVAGSTYHDHFPSFIFWGGSRYYPYGAYGTSWNPFGGGSSGSQIDPTASRPAYRDPPSGVALDPSQPMQGSVASEAPKPLGERAIHSVAVAGKSSGTGAGMAVTGKATGGRATIISGKSGGTGSASAATGKSGSSGVKAPSSGGFSAGKGSSSGSASS